ncbi:MAG: VCBS repeat-containing protein, partial [Bacteroidota bacterium]
MMRRATRKILPCFLLSMLFACHSSVTDTSEIMSRRVGESFYSPSNLYASTQRVRHFDSLLTKANPIEKNVYEYELAKNLLYQGNTKAAIDLFSKLLQRSSSPLGLSGLKSYEEESLNEWLAVAYFRHGELENCIHDHNARSCLVPIDAAAIHHQTEGSRGAVSIYSEILEKNPYNIEALWMLNLSYMTLGEYPAGVPRKWLLPDSIFQSEYPMIRFQDIAANAGVAINQLAGGSILEDFNLDGHLDLVTSSWFPDHQIRYFTNNQDGTFSDKTNQAGLSGHSGGLNLLQTDYNNDGFPDIYVLRGAWLEELGDQPNTLLKNNGDGTFTDVTIAAGLLSFHPTQTATWSDFNNDGWLDVFIGNESTEAQIHPCELYINNQNGTFREVARQAGIEVSHDGYPYFIKGVTSGDYNNDQLTDIYVSVLRPTDSKNLLFKNTGPGDDGVPVFREVSTEAGLTGAIPTFPTWFWDYNNDGWLDIFAAGYSHDPFRNITADITNELMGRGHSAQTGVLFENTGTGKFRNVSKEVDLNRILFAMAANFGDLDNDGWLDLYLGTGDMDYASVIPNRMFRNAGGKHFQDVTTSGGFGHIQKGHAISFGDIDNDGDQDIYAVMGGAFEGDF